MKIPQHFKFTREISDHLSTIEANRSAIDVIKLPIEIELNLRSQSILGSAIYSARIEGNKLTPTEISSYNDLSTKDKNKLEIFNLHNAIITILEDYSGTKKITQKDILYFHRESMKNILFEDFWGKFRDDHEAIFDALGNVVYEAPHPKLVPSYIKKLIKFIASDKEKSIPIRAVLAHLTFEDIHPFVDGNGRVGRLLQFAILNSAGYGMRGLAFPEKLIEQNRKHYYRAIETSQSSPGDATEFVELMLNFLAQSSTLAKKLLLEKRLNYSPLDKLSPRHREIVEIIREQKTVSLDFIHRRFLKISPRQISYDLKKLSDKGYIIKLGSTRGALYSAK